MRLWEPREPALDRADDFASITALAEKPPILGRAFLRGVCLLVLALVVYGTVGPIGYERGAWLVIPASWSLFPPLQPSDANDVVTNLAVYLPVGIALRLLLRRRGRTGIGDFVLAVAIAAALSWMTEVLQQFMPARSSNRTDVWMNVWGATIGAAAAPQLQTLSRRMHAAAYAELRVRPWTVAKWFAIAVTALMMTVPFDVAWTPFAWRLSRPLELLDVRRAGMFAVVGFVLAMSLLERTGDVSAAVRGTLVRLLVLGGGLEAFQVFLASHEGDLFDVITTLVGGLCGCAAALWLIRHGFTDAAPGRTRAGSPPSAEVQTRRAARRAGRVFAVGVLMTLIAASLILSTYRLISLPVDLNGGSMIWLPFQLHFLRSFDRVLVDVAEALLLYGGLTVLCLYLGGLTMRGVALVIVLSHVALAQMLDLLFGRGMDVTPVLLAGVAWWLALRFWCALRTAKAQPLPVRQCATGRPVSGPDNPVD